MSVTLTHSQICRAITASCPPADLPDESGVLSAPRSFANAKLAEDGLVIVGFAEHADSLAVGQRRSLALSSRTLRSVASPP